MARMTISALPFFASSIADRLDMLGSYMKEPYISQPGATVLSGG
jgi:hypothetical protein